MATFSLQQKHAALDRHYAERRIPITRTPTEPAEKPTLSLLGDERQLRGIPAIARAVTGAIAGTTPGRNL